MSVIISDDILQASQLTPSEFCQEVALYLFQTGCLTLGYASKLAEIRTNDFHQLLKQRNIPLYVYDITDFELDLKNLQELGRNIISYYRFNYTFVYNRVRNRKYGRIYKNISIIIGGNWHILELA